MGTREKELLQVQHFIHPHSLQLTLHSLPSDVKLGCFGCSLKIMPGNDYFKCQTCSFSLHYVCFYMPKTMSHQAHPQHTLTLFNHAHDSSVTNQDMPSCRACGHQVNAGFYYHCPECTEYYHSLCFTLPLSLSISSHAHKINLEFSPPYDFYCDLCNKPSSHNSGWLYRCNKCEFDAHIACVIANFGPDNGVCNKLKQVEAGNILAGQENKILQTSSLGKDGSEGVGNIGGTFKSPNQSDDVISTPPSWQFSEACFSIDLAKSYSSYDPNNYNIINKAGLAEKKGAVHVPIGLNSSIFLADKSLTKKQLLDGVNFPSFRPYNYDIAGEKNSNGQKLMKGKGNKTLVKPSVKDQERVGCSCWGKFASRT